MNLQENMRKLLSNSNSAIATPNASNSPYRSSLKKIVIKKAHPIKTLSLKTLHRSTLSSSFVKTQENHKGLDKRPSAKEKLIKSLMEKVKCIEAAQKDNHISYEIFEAHKEIFDEIIAYDADLSFYLLKVKNAYDSWIKRKIGYVAENTQLKDDIEKQSKFIQELTDSNDEMIKRLKNAIKEKSKMKNELNVVNSQYRSLQEHLIKIHNVADNDYAKTGDGWKIIIAENQAFKGVVDELKTEIERLKDNEKKLMLVIDYAQAQGFSISKAYKHLESLKNKEMHFETESDQGLVSSPLKHTSKPQGIPNLNLASKSTKKAIPELRF